MPCHILTSVVTVRSVLATSFAFAVRMRRPFRWRPARRVDSPYMRAELLPDLPLRRGFLIATLLSLLVSRIDGLHVGRHPDGPHPIDRRDEGGFQRHLVGKNRWPDGLFRRCASCSACRDGSAGVAARLRECGNLACDAGQVRPNHRRLVLACSPAATLAYNALWYPRTFFGAHYYDRMVAEVGPFHVGQLVYGSVVIAAGAILVAGGLVTCDACIRHTTALGIAGIAASPRLWLPGFWPNALTSLLTPFR